MGAMPDSVDREISDRIGLLPTIFSKSNQKPALWAYACTAYLDNPLPSLFKERLFAYLSRYSNSSYCVCRHSAFLLGYGNIAGDKNCSPISAAELFALLNAPLPEDNYATTSKALVQSASPIELWPSSKHQTQLADALFWNSVLCFAGRDHLEVQQSSQVLKENLSPHLYMKLTEFLAFIKLTHFESELNPEISLETDVDRMMRDVPEFEVWLRHNPPTAWINDATHNIHETADDLETTNRALVNKNSELLSEIKCLKEMMVAELSTRNKIERALKKTNTDLMQTQKMESIGRLAAGVAHDFNNDLTIISGGIQCLLGEGVIKEDNEYAKMIGQACDHASSLVSKLLLFGRKNAANPETFDLGDLVTESKLMLTGLTGETIDLDLHCENGAFIYCDANEIQQVIINLLLNAKDAVGQNGRISVSVGVTEPDQRKIYAPMVKLCVADNGEGMSQNVLDDVFEPFFTTKEPNKGTGLGLSMVFSIVNELGGWIEASSKLGEGTEFNILLPLQKPKPAPKTRHVNAELVVQPTRRTILICDDNECIMKLLETGLKRSGYRVLTASSAEDAIDTARANSKELCLLLSDVVMPTLSGPELAVEVQKIVPTVKFVFMTGYSDQGTFSVGDTEVSVICKPFDMKYLAETVAFALNHSSAQIRVQ